MDHHCCYMPEGRLAHPIGGCCTKVMDLEIPFCSTGTVVLDLEMPKRGEGEEILVIK